MKPNINSWQENVHVEEIERRVAWLEKQVAAAEEAIAAQREIIEHDGLTFAYKLSLRSLESSHEGHVTELATLMQKRRYETLNFALDGEKYAQHRAPASVLAEFIGTVQQLFIRIAQGIDTGRFVQTVSPNLRRACQLDVAAFYPSSFGVQFVAPTNTDLTGQSVSVLAMEKTMALVTAEQPLDEAASIGPYALRQYRKLIKTLIDAEASPKVEWITPAGKEVLWRADHNRLLTLANRLSHIKTNKPVIREAIGTLCGASVRRQRFEFASNGQIITGTAPRDLSAKVTAYFNKPCTIVYSETIYIDEATDQEKKVRSLVDLRP